MLTNLWIALVWFALSFICMLFFDTEGIGPYSCSLDIYSFVLDPVSYCLIAMPSIMLYYETNIVNLSKYQFALRTGSRPGLRSKKILSGLFFSLVLSAMTFILSLVTALFLKLPLYNWDSANSSFFLSFHRQFFMHAFPGILVPFFMFFNRTFLLFLLLVLVDYSMLSRAGIMVLAAIVSFVEWRYHCRIFVLLLTVNGYFLEPQGLIRCLIQTGIYYILIYLTVNIFNRKNI
ncbi:MAG: hypothetical protein VZR00_04975 [Lachnospiraceae bacterium]|jgi:hypothetical protein|nr:hypothetical protein [Lachnospiraceae bacterium]MEE3461229.1 hypothetical protein [Lachnospiraceae bacterium]